MPEKLFWKDLREGECYQQVDGDGAPQGAPFRVVEAYDGGSTGPYVEALGDTVHAGFLGLAEGSYVPYDEDEEDIPVDSVTLTMVAVREHRVPAGVDLDRIGEAVIEAAFKTAHTLLEEAEGHKRYGDVMPGEAFALEALGKLIVRSVLANEPWNEEIERKAAETRAALAARAAENH